MDCFEMMAEGSGFRIGRCLGRFCILIVSCGGRSAPSPLAVGLCILVHRYTSRITKSPALLDVGSVWTNF